MNNQIIITACTLKHNMNKIENLIVSIIEAENDDSSSIVEGRNYGKIKEALQKGGARVYVTAGDPNTKLTIDLLKDETKEHDALYTLLGHYHTSNGTPIEEFIDSITKKMIDSVLEVVKDVPRVSTASFFFSESDGAEEQIVSDKSERAKTALRCATKLWEQLTRSDC